VQISEIQRRENESKIALSSSRAGTLQHSNDMNKG